MQPREGLCDLLEIHVSETLVLSCHMHAHYCVRDTRVELPHVATCVRDSRVELPHAYTWQHVLTLTCTRGNVHVSETLVLSCHMHAHCNTFTDKKDKTFVGIQ